VYTDLATTDDFRRATCLYIRMAMDKSLARCVSAPTDGIRFALAFLYEMVVEETHGHQTLLERRVCQTDARIEDDYACSTSVRASDQIAHVAGDLSASGR